MRQIPEMLLTPSRPQARDWEALAGFLQVEEGGGERKGEKEEEEGLRRWELPSLSHSFKCLS